MLPQNVIRRKKLIAVYTVTCMPDSCLPSNIFFNSRHSIDVHRCIPIPHVGSDYLPMSTISSLYTGGRRGKNIGNRRLCTVGPP